MMFALMQIRTPTVDIYVWVSANYSAVPVLVQLRMELK